MKIEKQTLLSISMPYAVAPFSDKGNIKALFASEDRNGSCSLVSLEDPDIELIWNSPGGTMNLIQNSNKQEFWAIQKFFPIFDSKDAEIIQATQLSKGEWAIRMLGKLPYVHRIATFQIQDELYMLACSLCSNKNFIEDWSTSGAVYLSRIPQNKDQSLDFQCILEGITKNHGLSISSSHQQTTFLISGKEGIFEIKFHAGMPLSWTIDKILERETSEAILFDIDNDGQEELITIEGFHGDLINFYKQKGKLWQQIYSIDISFGHVLKPVNISGRNCILVGNRGGSKDISLYFPTDSTNFSCERVVIDTGVGATQIEVVYDRKGVRLLSANHAVNEAAVYTLT